METLFILGYFPVEHLTLFLSLISPHLSYRNAPWVWATIPRALPPSCEVKQREDLSHRGVCGLLHDVLETQVQLFWARLLHGITMCWKDEADEFMQAVLHDTPLHLYTLPPLQHPTTIIKWTGTME